MDSPPPCLTILVPRPDTPRPNDNMEINLRTPSYSYNHGGYYAPGDPRQCNTPGGPCGNCQERIEQEDAAAALLKLSKECCASRPTFMEPCPDCSAVGTYVTHASRGIKCCNGCSESVCGECFDGARYYCPLRKVDLAPPAWPLDRQVAVGVQTPKAEEKTENK